MISTGVAAEGGRGLADDGARIALASCGAAQRKNAVGGRV